MLMRKRIPALLCAAALVLSLLAGCSSEKDTQPPAEAEPEASVPETILWINATHAVLTELNGWDYTKFGGMDATDANKEMMIPFLDEWWGVTDHDLSLIHI